MTSSATHSLTAATKAAPHRAALAGLSLSLLLASLGTSIANVALPTLAQVFAAPFQQVQWVVLAYLLGMTATVVSAGRLGDMLGRRRLLVLGISLFAAAALVASVAPLAGLVLARAVQGLGAAVMMALSMAFVADIVPREQTGRAMGLLGTMSAVGTAMGPSLGGLLIASLGWQSIFWVQAPLAGVALWLVLRTLPQDKPAERHVPFDYAGTTLLVLALLAYALAMTLGKGHFGWLNLGLLALTGGLGVGFAALQRRLAAPLLQLGLLRQPGMPTGLLGNVLVATVMMTTFVVGPFYLAHGLGLSAGAVGLVMSAGPVMSALCGVPSGQLVDRFGTRGMTVVGILAMVAGLLLLAFLPSTLGVLGYVLPILLLTPGYALFQAANNTQVMSGIAAGQRGVVSGLLNLARNLGLITGASAMGAVFALAVGQGVATAPASAVAQGMHLSFAVAAGLMGLALAAFAWPFALVRRAR